MSENLTVQNEENITIATFNITEANTTITLQNLTGMTSIDWGDGTVNGELSHEYVEVGEYTCRIYDATEIGIRAFYNCDSLTHIIIGNSVTSIGADAFFSCSQLTNIVIGDGVTSIGGSAFKHCISLTSVTIGNRVVSIEDGAFSYCNNLISVCIKDIAAWCNISGLERLMKNKAGVKKRKLYLNYEAITELVVPDSVTSINSYAFYSCDSLTSVVIGDSVTSIGDYAFCGCDSLTSVIIPDSVISIGDYALYNCKNLKTAIFKSLTPISASSMKNSQLSSNVNSIFYVPTEAFEEYQTAWNGTIDKDRIQPDCVEKLVTVGGLREYNKSMKETYINPLKERIEEVENSFDLTDYVKNTDYASETQAGIVRIGKGFSRRDGQIIDVNFTLDGDVGKNTNTVLKSSQTGKIVKVGMTANEEEWTEKDKAAARELIGAAAEDDISGSAQAMISITYEELKELRDNAELVPGQFYRITDYMCTTAQENTRAMNHQFDIIVQALSESQLSENAKADYHDGDTYFKSNGATPIIPYYFIQIDSNGTLENNGDYFANKDRFVERGYLENDEGAVVPVLYKTGNDYSDDEADYDDPYFYMGREEYEGVTYDKWRHIEYNADGWDSEAQIYLYTNIIIADDGYTFLTDGNGGEKIANLNAWELKYCLDNDTDRFAWANDKAVLRVIDEEDSYMYIRFPDGDNENGYAWAYANTSDNKDFSEFADWDNIDTDDVIYTQTMDLKHGDPLDMGDTPVTVVDYRKELGRGVIYWMKDEWNNECPYDFKNIQFKRNISLVNGYPELDNENGEETWVYTFCGNSYHIDNDEWSELKDGSMESPYGHQSDEGYSVFSNNIVREYRKIYDDINEDNTKTGILFLNSNVFLGYWKEVGSTLDENLFYSAYCCHNNNLGTDCINNTFNSSCCYNVLKSQCFDNIFGFECKFNEYGFRCYSNILGDNACWNKFENICSNNVLNQRSSYNTFGIGCQKNVLGEVCFSNTFGQDCNYNTFGNSFCHSTFGNCCNYISIEYNDIRNIRVAEDCSYIQFVNNEEASYLNKIQNITIEQGVLGNGINRPLRLQVNRNAAPVIFRAKNTQEIILD